MHRILLVLLVACGQLDRVGDTADMVDWLERYDRVRACVVSALGDSVAQGTAVALLQGVECDEPLAEVTQNVPFDQVSTARWHQLAKSFAHPSAHVRAHAIETADLEVGAIREAYHLGPIEDRRTALPVLRGTPLEVRGRPVRSGGPISFNAGHIRGSEGPNGFVVTPRLSSLTWREPEAEPDAIAVAETGRFRVVVRREEGAAYSVSAAHDGKPWRMWRGPARGRVVDVYQDRAFDWVELLVADDQYTSYRVQLSPWRPEPEVFRMNHAVGGREVCRDFANRYGHVWRLEGLFMSHLHDTTVEHHRLSVFVSDAQFDCRRDRVLVLHRPNGLERDVLERCGSECFRVFHSKSRVPGVAALLDDQTWIYAASTEGVVVIHREGKPAEVYQLPSSSRMVALTVLDGPHLVIDEGGLYTLVPLS